MNRKHRRCRCFDLAKWMPRSKKSMSCLSRPKDDCSGFFNRTSSEIWIARACCEDPRVSPAVIWGTLCLSAFLWFIAGSGSIAFGSVAAITSAWLVPFMSFEVFVGTWSTSNAHRRSYFRTRRSAWRPEAREGRSIGTRTRVAKDRIASKQNEERMRRIVRCRLRCPRRL